ncbi:sialate O-acetylesterase [Rhodopirellula sp. JC639]|uniref:sialate O-acetylesterase n=1 Tax=Stieleria mannarensis TaxID=2755585 RepID=UPI0016005808|nr:sialate O-acetylesterase [Rhodopirellula sp. JC639]
MRKLLFACLMLLAAAPVCLAEIRTSAVFGDSMVLQREKPIHVWGWSAPDRSVQVSLAGHAVTVKSGSDGRFDAQLPALEAGGPHTMKIESDGETLSFGDVLIGEVWVCSGQSNMQWAVEQSNDADLEALAAKFPNLRLITVPRVGTQEPQNSFDGQWQSCTPETVKQFSAVGYFFGRQLHQTLDIPVGLIDNAWGGSAAEAWVNRDVLKESGEFDELLERWRKTESTYDHEKEIAKYNDRLAAWKESGKGRRPAAPRNPLVGQHRPANLYNGVLYPIIGYTIRGVVWYQGESNAGRAYQYRDLFPTMIQNWRDEWGQDEFPFYWVQLADYRSEASQPSDSDWAELREAQTMTMDKLPNTGEAVILNLGEASDIHPKNKQDVGKRLARWALAKDYGYDIPYRSPTYKSMSAKDGKIVLEFDHVGGGLDTFDVPTPLGFTIAGADKKFVAANAKITGKTTIEVSSDAVSDPVAVRYAWADNPVCNVQSKEGLPMTPFRTDDWKGVTADAK